MTNPSLPSPGSPRSSFPCFNGTMNGCDSLCPSHSASLCFAWQFQLLASVLRSLRSTTRNRGHGVPNPVPLPEHRTWRRPGSPKVPGEPWRTYAVFFDPGRTDTSGRYGVPTRPPSRPCQRLPRVVLSRLNSTGLALAVYASQWSLLAPTQDWLAVAGQALPGGIGDPQGSDERFQTVVLLLSQVSWRNDGLRILFCLIELRKMPFLARTLFGSRYQRPADCAPSNPFESVRSKARPL